MKEQKKLIVLDTNGVIRIENAQPDVYNQISGLVGGYIERMPIRQEFKTPKGMSVWANEEGHIRGLAFNPSATYLYGGMIVGRCVISTGSLKGMSEKKCNEVWEWLKSTLI